MARSIAEAQQELDRLNSMFRSLPDQRDDAAQKMASRIKAVEQEIRNLENAPPPKKSSGFGVTTVLICVVVVGAIAFAGAYFGSSMTEL